MKKFTIINSSCVPINWKNIDTDQILPARFMTGVKKTGFAKLLFYDHRYDKDGKPNKSFVLNDDRYKGHKILVAGHNFGCGSSREHAPWAISQYGFRVVISSMFSSIFKNNALKNALLLVEVPEAELESIFAEIEKNPKFKITVNLPDQTISFANKKIKFKISPFRKRCIINGYDDVNYLFSKKKEIKKYELANKK
ncbi:MAG: 3-isopropylmalate dehydratase small subunit [Candidatus Woesebacteria bacterium]|jgi:3-isopropylmalate/(R)-2-methylmalate dehydratase small subunit